EHGRARAEIPGGSPSDGPPGAAIVGGGLSGAVDARREPDQVAPRAHIVVLRDVRARRRAASAVLRLPVQFVLRGGRPAPPARRARAAVAAVAGRGQALSPPR